MFRGTHGKSHRYDTRRNSEGVCDQARREGEQTYRQQVRELVQDMRDNPSPYPNGPEAGVTRRRVK